MAHLPAWLAYPLLPAFAVTAVGLSFAKRRRFVWLGSYMICGLILGNIDFKSLGPRAGQVLYSAFCILGLIGFTLIVICDLFKIGGLLTREPAEWQKEFDEARRLAKQNIRRTKESNES